MSDELDHAEQNDALLDEGVGKVFHFCRRFLVLHHFLEEDCPGKRDQLVAVAVCIKDRTGKMIFFHVGKLEVDRVSVNGQIEVSKNTLNPSKG